MDDESIFCPLVDKNIEPIDCMENRDVNDDCVPKEYKKKDNWKEVCKNCKYHEW